MRFVRLLLGLLVALVAVPAVAQTFPQLTGRVVDRADLLPPAEEAALTARLEQLERESGRQLVVATVPSLEGRTIEDYGYRLGRTWGIGQEGEDDGVILLVAPNERKVRIETGYGARVFLTDAVSSVIIRNAITPRFRQGEYAAGISAGVNAIIEQMRLPPAEAQRRAEQIGQQEAQRQPARGGGFNLAPLIFWGMVIMFVLLSFGRRGGGRRYRGRRRRGGMDTGDVAVLLWGLDALSRGSRGGWGGGGGGWGGGGGFGGFSGGGGSFGGGGASGSW